MKIVMTGPQLGSLGNLLYCNEEMPERGQHAFGMKGNFRLEETLGFTTISGYAANANYAPEGLGGAITHDLGLDFLFSIAGAR
ncbi:hypothetical protein [Sulfitobacter sp. JB4-11]|uniref:hypothetical protein n=1 Tax=Sulfitobacter rhodophyticola TaxID=3238304 RepID=UPI003515A72E